MENYVKQCPKCYKWYNGDEHDKLCSDCLELAVEDNEIRKRARIAELNEY
jgi:hypothetical protein